MSDDIVIKLEDVSKKFSRRLRHVMFYGALDITRNMMGLNSNSGELRNGEFWAVKNVSFELRRGETLGIIGPNGSGKSTLLKMLNGIFMPDEGRIEIKGRVGALIEIGAGFHPLLTGRENIYINGAILGMSKKEIDKKFDEIVDFADIGDFIDSPVKHYSSGMYVRLGFAIAVHCEPDILLIDEALAVGDAQFVQKCLRKLEEFQEKGVTIILVSHDMSAVKKNCQQAILLDKGEIIDKGEPKEIVDVYNAHIFEKIAADIQGEDPVSSKDIVARRVSGKSQRYGSGEAEIIDVELLNSNGIQTKNIISGEQTCIRIKTLCKADLDNVFAGITIRNRIGIDIFMLNTLWKGVEIHPAKMGELIVVEFNQQMLLGPDEYFINVGVAISLSQGIKKLDWISDYYSFNVVTSEKFGGLCNLNSNIKIHTVHDYNTAK